MCSRIKNIYCVRDIFNMHVSNIHNLIWQIIKVIFFPIQKKKISQNLKPILKQISILDSVASKYTRNIRISLEPKFFFYYFFISMLLLRTNYTTIQTKNIMLPACPLMVINNIFKVKYWFITSTN